MRSYNKIIERYRRIVYNKKNKNYHKLEPIISQSLNNSYTNI
jgi:hypothetical protein